MALDTNIALGVRPVEQPNMLAQMGQMMQLRSAQQEYEGQNALRDAFASGGSLSDPAFVQRLRAANPKMAFDIEAKHLAGEKTRSELLGNAYKNSREALTMVNSPESLRAYTVSQFNDPIIGPALKARGITPETAVANLDREIATSGFNTVLKKSAMGLDSFFKDETSRRNTDVSSGASYGQLELAKAKDAREQQQQAEITALLRGGAPSSAPTNMLVPGAQAPAAPSNDPFVRIDAIDARIEKLRETGNPKAIPFIQELISQRTQLLASAKNQFGGPLVPMETIDPATNRPTVVQGRLNQRGVLEPVEMAPVPLSVNATAGSNLAISPNVARPAPSAAVIKERQVAEKLPEAIAMNTDAIRKIDEMIGGLDANGKPLPGAKGKPHPGFNEAVGAGFGTAYIPGTQGKSFTIRHKEVLSQAFLDAFEALKGGGAITEKEGEKATAARTRMDLAQSETEYMAAAREYQGVLKRGVENAKARIQRSGGAAPITATPEASATPVIKSEAEYNALPSGATYIDPDGVSRRKR
tara:strand:+ start:1154 stop:2737 length:1584 start_codon:yes stop_codon:yes gene_type:complete